MTSTPFRRVLLKLSGESLMGEAGYGMDPSRIAEIAYAIQQVQEEGVEVEFALAVGDRADHDDAVAQPRQQQVRQREVAEVVGRELQLDAVGAAGERHAHDTGVVDEHVDLADLVGEGADRGEVGEVQLRDLDVPHQGARRLDTALDAAAGEDHRGPRGTEGAGGLEPDPGVGAGDDEPSSVLAREQVRGGSHDTQPVRSSTLPRRAPT